MTALSDLCNDDFLRSRNSVLVQFLSGLLSQTNIPWVTPTTKDDTPALTCSVFLPFLIQTPADIYKIAKVTEACMGLTMSNRKPHSTYTHVINCPSDLWRHSQDTHAGCPWHYGCVTVRPEAQGTTTRQGTGGTQQHHAYSDHAPSSNPHSSIRVSWLLNTNQISEDKDQRSV